MKKSTRWFTAAITIAAIVLSRWAEAAPVCGDVNASGDVTAGDALSVLKDAVGQPVDLKCGPPADPLRTGDVTDYGSRSDGVVQAGTARSFTDNGDGTVTDNATGLMWEKKDNSGGIHDKDNGYTWSGGSGDLNGTIVSDFLASLNGGAGYAGHKDWRIPNRFELETLLNVGEDAPSTYLAFSNSCPTSCTVITCSCTRSGSYWSSTTFFSDTTGAWVVDFLDADTAPILKTGTLRARAVRGGL